MSTPPPLVGRSPDEAVEAIRRWLAEEGVTTEVRHPTLATAGAAAVLLALGVAVLAELPR